MVPIRWTIAGCVILGTVLRFAVSGFGSNYDFASYQIVAELVHGGFNVYVHTERFNYAPPWAWLLGGFRAITGGDGDGFRALIIGLLTLADLGTAAVLARVRGPRVAMAFFLNPVSILITGFHNQFDTLAISIGLAAALLVQTRPQHPWMGRVALGASLAVKHVFFLLPLWWAVRERDSRSRLLALVIPVGVFAAMFVPYLGGGGIGGIREHVVGYSSKENAPLLTLLTPFGDQPGVARLLFLGVLVAVGYASRDSPPVDQALRYLLVVVCFAPAMANQYLAIAMPAVVVYFNGWMAAYTAVATAIIVANQDGLNSRILGDWLTDQLVSPIGYRAAAGLLGLGLLWQVLPQLRTRSPHAAAS